MLKKLKIIFSSLKHHVLGLVTTMGGTTIICGTTTDGTTTDGTTMGGTTMGGTTTTGGTTTIGSVTTTVGDESVTGDRKLQRWRSQWSWSLDEV